MREHLQTEVFALQSAMTATIDPLNPDRTTKEDRGKIAMMHHRLLRGFDEVQDRYEAECRSMGYLEEKKDKVQPDVSKIVEAAMRENKRWMERVPHSNWLS